MVSAGYGKAYTFARYITDMGDTAAGLARGYDGIGARQAGQLAVMTAKVQAQGEYFTTAAADLDLMFLLPVRFSIDMLGRIACRTDNRGGIVGANKGLDLIHNDQCLTLAFLS